MRPWFALLLASILTFSAHAEFLNWGCSYTDLNGHGGICPILNSESKGSGPSLMHASPNGGQCASSQTALGSLYSHCSGGIGRSSAPSTGGFAPGAAHEPWSLARSIVSLGDLIPGKYSPSTVTRFQKEFDDHLAHVESTLNDFKEHNLNLDKATSQYTENVFATATKTVREDRVPQIEQAFDDHLAPLLKKEAPVRRDTAPLPDLPSTSPIANSYLEEIERQSTPFDKWNELQAVWEGVQDGGLDFLSGNDRAATQALYDTYFDSSGLLAEKALGTDFAPLSKALSGKLHTDAKSLAGRELRFELNRGLSLAASTKDAERQSTALGGLAFLMGADSALASGDDRNAKQLFEWGTQAFDFMIGFTPAGGVNDFAQIVHGMATGYDYSGNRMETSDYVLRGVGIVASVFPVGKATIKIGKATFGKAFVEGCELVKTLKLREFTFKSLQKIESFSETVVSALGRRAPGILKNAEPEKRAVETIQHLTSARKKYSDEAVEKLARLLGDPESGDIIARTFVPGELRIKSHKKYVYRWHNGDDEVRQVGRFLGVEAIENRDLAKELYALPPDNKMTFLDVFEVQGEYFEGVTQEFFDKVGDTILRRKGGGTQVFVSDPQRDLKFVKRLVGPNE